MYVARIATEPRLYLADGREVVDFAVVWKNTTRIWLTAFGLWYWRALLIICERGIFCGACVFVRFTIVWKRDWFFSRSRVNYSAIRSPDYIHKRMWMSKVVFFLADDLPQLRVCSEVIMCCIVFYVIRGVIKYIHTVLSFRCLWPYTLEYIYRYVLFEYVMYEGVSKPCTVCLFGHCNYLIAPTLYVNHALSAFAVMNS